jgi:hypothetical protein
MLVVHNFIIQGQFEELICSLNPHKMENSAWLAMGEVISGLLPP